MTNVQNKGISKVSHKVDNVNYLIKVKIMSSQEIDAGYLAD